MRGGPPPAFYFENLKIVYKPYRTYKIKKLPLFFFFRERGGGTGGKVATSVLWLCYINRKRMSPLLPAATTTAPTVDWSVDGTSVFTAHCRTLSICLTKIITYYQQTKTPPTYDQSRRRPTV